MPFPFVSARTNFGLLASLLLLASACKKDSDMGVKTEAALPSIIKFAQPGLYPEGTQYDSQSGRFLVSSQTTSRIGQVASNLADTTTTGTYSIFAEDDRLVSTIGLNLDASRNRLLAAVSDPGYNTNRTSAATLRKLAAVAIFNRSTGTLGDFVNLSAVSPSTYTNHFANDIAIDAQGSAYVTDSYAPIIYKITFDASGKSTPSVWLTNSALSAPAGQFGLNGIVYHPSGYLLVAKSDEGKLLKIPIISTTTAGVTTTAPGALTTVTLPTGLSLSGADGLQLINNTTLHVVCNAQGKVYRLVSATDFAAVNTTGTFDATVGGVSPYPTTLAQRNVSGPGTTSVVSANYVLYAYLNVLQAAGPTVQTFALKRVIFK